MAEDVTRAMAVVGTPGRLRWGTAQQVLVFRGEGKKQEGAKGMTGEKKGEAIGGFFLGENPQTGKGRHLLQGDE